MNIRNYIRQVILETRFNERLHSIHALMQNFQKKFEKGIIAAFNKKLPAYQQVYSLSLATHSYHRKGSYYIYPLIKFINEQHPFTILVNFRFTSLYLLTNLNELNYLSDTFNAMGIEQIIKKERLNHFLNIKRYIFITHSNLETAVNVADNYDEFIALAENLKIETEEELIHILDELDELTR